MLWLGDGGIVRRREPSPACSRNIKNFNACPTQGARHPRLDWVGKDQIHYGDNNPNNHGHHPRVWDARRSPSPDACGPLVFVKRIWQTPFSACFRAPPNIVKYSRDINPIVWLEDFRLAYQAGRTDDDLFIIQYLPLYLVESARAWLEHLPMDSIH